MDAPRICVVTFFPVVVDLVTEFTRGYAMSVDVLFPMSETIMGQVLGMVGGF